VRPLAGQVDLHAAAAGLARVTASRTASTTGRSVTNQGGAAGASAAHAGHGRRCGNSGQPALGRRCSSEGRTCSGWQPALLPARGGGGRNQCHGAGTGRASCVRSRAPNNRLHIGFIDNDGTEVDEGGRRRTAAGRRRWPGRLRGGCAAKALARHPSYMQHTGLPHPTEFEHRRQAAEDLANWETSSSG
jgi:hypothetical protein